MNKPIAFSYAEYLRVLEENKELKTKLAAAQELIKRLRGEDDD